MISHQEFTEFLWESLGGYEYVWLNPNVKLQKEKIVPEILVTSKSIHNLLPQLRRHQEVGSCRASFRYQNTLAVFSFGDWSYPINFVHKMVSQNLYYLEEDQILAQRVLSNDGIYIPGVEHLFEYTILKNFLNRKGLNENEYAFFNDFHIFSQEGLLDFFNEKYGTNFETVFSTTQYNIAQKRAMLGALKELSINKFTKVVNIHWHNFLGRVRKEARMI